MQSESLYCDVREVQKITGRSQRASYRIIAELNCNLQKAGKLVIHGKVPRAYLMKKIDCSDVD